MAEVIRGLEGLKRKFRDLDRRAQGAALRRALLAASKPLGADARARAPRGRTGALAKGIIARRKRGRSAGRGIMAFGVGPSAEVFYGVFQELGTIHHVAQPFLRPAFDAQRDAAVQGFAGVMRREVLRVGR